MYIFIKLNCRVKKDYVSLELPVQLSFLHRMTSGWLWVDHILQWINHLKFYEAVRTEYTYTALLYLTNQVLYFLYYTTLTIYWMLGPFWLTKPYIHIHISINSSLPFVHEFPLWQCWNKGRKQRKSEWL